MKSLTLRDLGFFFLGVIITAIILRASFWVVLLGCIVSVSIYVINKDKKKNEINKETK